MLGLGLVLGSSIYAPPQLEDTTATDNGVAVENVDPNKGEVRTPGSVVLAVSLGEVAERGLRSWIQAELNKRAQDMINNNNNNNSVSLSDVNVARAAGSNQKMTTWVRLGHTGLRDRSLRQRMAGEMGSAILGFDYRVNNMILFGLSLNATKLDVTSEFNNGKIRETSFGAMPYFLVVPHKNIYVELFAGYRASSHNDHHVQTYKSGANNFDAKLESKPKSNTLFGAMFVNLTHDVNNWNLNLRFGFTAFERKIKAFTSKVKQTSTSTLRLNVPKVAERKNDVQTASTRFTLTHNWNQNVAPFLFVGGSYDVKEATPIKYQNEEANDTKVKREMFEAGFGVKFNKDDQMTGDLRAGYFQRGELRGFTAAVQMGYAF